MVQMLAEKRDCSKKAPLQAEQILQVQDLSIYYGEKERSIKFHLKLKKCNYCINRPIRVRKIDFYAALTA